MKTKKFKWKVSFEIDAEDEIGIDVIHTHPSSRFVEGCLLDLENSHGLNCKNILIKKLL